MESMNGNTTNVSLSHLAEILLGNYANNGTLPYDLLSQFDQSWLTDDFIQTIEKDYIRIHDPVVIILVILYIISFSVGLVGNILVIFVFLRIRRLRTVTNIFLVNLAVCDLMVVTFCMPFTLAADVYTQWIYGDVMCKLVNYVQGLSISSSILTLSVISAERFLAIKKPLKARAFLTRNRTQKIIALIWIISSVIVCPELFIRQYTVTLVEQILGIKYHRCSEIWPSPAVKYAYVFGLLILLYLIPLGMIFVGYCKISARLWRNDEHLHAIGQLSNIYPRQAHKMIVKRRKVAKMLLVLAIIFCVSWLPRQVLSFTLDFMEGAAIGQAMLILRKLYSFALWFGLTNSSINPICYCVLSESFRSGCKRAFQCCFTFRLSEYELAQQSASFSLTSSTRIMIRTSTTLRNGTMGTMDFRAVQKQMSCDSILEEITNITVNNDSVGVICETKDV